jgi:hypothetical protein
MSRSSQHRLIAILLAGMYALMACAGQGLHQLAHLAAPVVANSSETTSACGCGETGCFFAKRANRNESGNGFSFRTTESQKPHDPHQCGLCRTLAQMKVAAAAAPPVASFETPACYLTPVAEGLLSEQRLLAFDARGPPANG